MQHAWNRAAGVLVALVAATVLGGYAPAAAAESLAGKVMTVRGPIAPEALGMTLPHEHLFVDLRPPADTPAGWRALGAARPATPAELAFYAAPLTLERIGAASMGRPNQDNLRLDDAAVIAREATGFKWLGGGTIVELTSADVGRDPAALARLAALTGLNVVMGTGWHAPGYAGDAVDGRAVEELTAELVRDIVAGVPGTGIRAGIIGEIGIEDAARTYERKVLAAAAEASRRTGAAISLGVLSGRRAQLAALAVLQDAGADLRRVAVGHANLIATDLPLMRRILQQGAYLQFDTLGRPPHVLTEVSDHDVALAIVALIAEGHGGQILLSQDVHAKTDLQAYGGSGYAFIAARFIPYLRQLGVTAPQITRIVVENPGRLLTLARPLPARNPT